MGCGQSSPNAAPTSTQPQPQKHTVEQKYNRATDEEQRQNSARAPSAQHKSPAAEDAAAGSEFLELGLKRHNELRVKHGAVALTTSAQLTSFSQKWAEHLAKKDSMEHSSNQQRDKECGGAGENLYCCWSSSPDAGVSAEDAVQSWYDEIKDYNFSSGGFAMDTGHFTQVVWKGSRELGMGWAQSKKGTFYVVANYKPAGNFMGQFDDNVVPAS